MPNNTNTPILFYGQHRQYREFSNWYPTRFEYDNMYWTSSEQAYMYYKSDDPFYRKQIRGISHPSEAKRLGRKVKLRPGWDRMKYKVMVEVNLAKFSQNSELKELLLSTNDRSIHEDCSDPWWGGGPNFPRGKDMLGKALIEVRRRIKES